MPSSACQKSALDRKSTRLNSSHTIISYAVFCLKKKTEVAWAAGELAPPPATQHSARRHRRRHARRARERLRRAEPASPDLARCFCFFFKRGGPPQTSPLFPPRPLSR